MGSSHSGTEAFEEDEVLAVMPLSAWARIPASVPGSGRAEGICLRAGRAFAPGEVVEQSFCLELKPDELMHSYLAPFVFPAHWPSKHPTPQGGAAPGARLFP